jgi:hypothetical protein
MAEPLNQQGPGISHNGIYMPNQGAPGLNGQAPSVMRSASVPNSAPGWNKASQFFESQGINPLSFTAPQQMAAAVSANPELLKEFPTHFQHAIQNGSVTSQNCAYDAFAQQARAGMVSRDDPSFDSYAREVVSNERDLYNSMNVDAGGKDLSREAGYSQGMSSSADKSWAGGLSSTPSGGGMELGISTPQMPSLPSGGASVAGGIAGGLA